MMWIEVLAIILAFFWLAVSGGGISGVTGYYRSIMDGVSLVAILLLTLPVLFRKGMWKDFINAVKLQRKKFSCSLGEMKKAQYAVEFLQKQLLWAGLFTLIFTLIQICNDGWWDSNITLLETLGACLGIALICPLYTVILEFLLLPLELEVKRRIADYLEEE